MAGSWNPYGALFSGQLSERVGMGRDFLELDPRALEIVEKTEQRCGRELIRPMLEGPSGLLSRDEVAQPAIFALGCASWEALLRSGAPLPRAVAGYSLGNYAALVAAEAIEFDDALAVLLRVLDLVHDMRIEGAMAAVVGMGESTVRSICEEVQLLGEWVEPANLNADNQIVVAGTSTGIDLFLERAAPKCLKAIRLTMTLPIHSRLMSPIADALRVELPGAVDVRAPRIPYFAASFGRPVTTAEDVLEILISQVERPSYWNSTIQGMLGLGLSRFVEFGTGTVLSKMLRWIDRRAEAFAIESPKDFERLLQSPAEATA